MAFTSGTSWRVTKQWPDLFRFNELCEYSLINPGRYSTRHHRPNNGNRDFVNLQNIWRQMQNFLDDNMSTGKGVALGDLGIFTWRNVETRVAAGTTKYHREPCLVLRESFIRANSIRTQGDNIYMQGSFDLTVFQSSPFVPVVPLNYNTLAFETGLERDMLKQSLDDFLIDWRDLVKDGANVILDFGVATLTARNRQLTCVFNADFIARTREQPGDYNPLQFQHLVTERIGDSVVVNTTTLTGTSSRHDRAALAATAPDPRTLLPRCSAECLHTLEKIVAGLEVGDNEVLRRVGSTAVMTEMFSGFYLKREYIEALKTMIADRGMSIHEERPPESFREHVRGPCTYFRLIRAGLSFVVTISISEPHCSFSFWKRGGHTPFNVAKK
eukprot:gnl/Spiro4/18253_TR9758_c0_g1_i1.p1 gnl/Spiro4/18253_TR9758_c0_g1~~gnl/Spiro4/18253_TR9758_c0_g1_i1.p1  ORF type:complete len:385 (-),score=94.77 gnl/Spiro4/18253_TR9758_c0_g1_i1:71-1225(-)